MREQLGELTKRVRKHEGTAGKVHEKVRNHEGTAG